MGTCLTAVFKPQRDSHVRASWSRPVDSLAYPLGVSWVNAELSARAATQKSKGAFEKLLRLLRLIIHRDGDDRCDAAGALVFWAVRLLWKQQWVDAKAASGVFQDSAQVSLLFVDPTVLWTFGKCHRFAPKMTKAPSSIYQGHDIR